ncbi:MAG: hypothetical protein R3264_21750, partial [Anaerolineae bacterium]|nr:hypothetical protein [Anaerolineae bacterium]
RRRQTGEPVETVPVPIFDPRPPEVIAHAELNRIEALNLPAQRQIKEYYTLVSNCLRRYIEGRYRIPAMEQTTYELRTSFRRNHVAPNDSVGLLKLVTESDYVKFARYQPREEEINSLINKARAVVDATTASAKAREIPMASPPASSPPAPPSMEPKEVQA